MFAFLVAFGFFFFIFFVNQLLLMAQQILAKRVPFGQVALLIFYALPSIIALAAPFASLVGTLMTIGRLTSDNEILVFLTSGLSYRNIFIPALAVGLVISMLSFFANDVLLPAGTVQFSRLYRRILISAPALELEANSVKRFKNTVVITGAVSNKSISDLIILDRTKDGERRIIMAKQAELRESAMGSLSLDLREAFIQSSKETVRDDYDYASSPFLRYSVPPEDLIQAVYAVGPREMSSVDVLREIRVMEQTLDTNLDQGYKRLLERALTLEASLRRGPVDSEWNRLPALISAFAGENESAAALLRDRTLLVFRLEFYKKFSIPFGALSFVFLAVSLGFLAKRSGQTVGFIIGISIAALYWALLLVGQTMGIQLGYSPFWSMWLPNILSITAGGILCLIRIRQ
ncbi:membrane protein [Spirochaetia bacterium]|nr:membrane protein [Spirochaetia bacterium]